MKIEYFKINEYPFSQYFIKILLIIWIVFAIYNFKINQNFFGFTIVVAVIIILRIAETTIETQNNFLEIKKKRWLSIFNKSERIDYKDIVDIEYINPKISGMSLFLNFIKYVPGTLRRGPKKKFTLQENKWKEIDTFGNKSKNGKLIHTIKKNIEITTYNN